MEYKCYYKSKLGKIILLSNGKELTYLCFDSSRFINEINKINFIEGGNLEIFDLTKKWLDRYFSKENPNPKEVPIMVNGSNFSKKVWEILKKIPYGEVATYGDVAKQIAKNNNMKKMSAQAVGHAVGHNPISIIIPCHRVIGANGNLTGYGGGIEKKIELLKLEKDNTNNFYVPKKGNAL